MEASEPKWVNPVLKTIVVNSLRFGGLHLMVAFYLFAISFIKLNKNNYSHNNAWITKYLALFLQQWYCWQYNKWRCYLCIHKRKAFNSRLFQNFHLFYILWIDYSGHTGQSDITNIQFKVMLLCHPGLYLKIFKN